MTTPSRHRILLQTDPCWLRSGLAENAKTLLRYLYKTGRYDIAHYTVQGTSTIDPRLQLTPWKSFGCIPPDQALINHINTDPQLQRNASYGSFNIDAVVKEWKPTIWIGANDAWSFPTGDYAEKPWYQQINAVHHITIDSTPVLDLAFEQAKRSKVYLTWAQFAAREMKRVRPDGSMNHVGSIYGAMDTSVFSPIGDVDKAAIRKQLGLDADTFVFLFVFRNQLRKSAIRIIEAFARFKRETPGVKAKLHFHTSFSEKGAGWDIPKMSAFYGLAPDDILCTYTCKACGRWWVEPYHGEDVGCPHCRADKQGITVNLHHGVPPQEMRVIYGIADACISAFTSGGQEYHNVQSLLCGKPLACTNGTCGIDFCTTETAPFIYPLKHHPYEEMGTNFLKTSTDSADIAIFMKRMVKASKRDLQMIGEHGRHWAARTFGIETIGAQWEKLFSTMPFPDWSSITLAPSVVKNEGFAKPEAALSDSDFVATLYAKVLLMDEKPDGEGFRFWMGKLQNGTTRDQVYDYFIGVAKGENAKSKPQQEFSTLLDNTGRRRGLFVIKESIGDVALCTALFRDFHTQNPGTDLYVATDPRFHELLVGNPYVHKMLPFLPQMLNELMMIGQGKGSRYFDVYYSPAVQTQQVLGYLGRGEPAFELAYTAATSPS